MGKTLSIVAFILSFLMPLVGLILGIVALFQAKNDKDALKGLAIAAIVIGSVLTLLAIIIIVFVAGMWIVLLGGSDPEAFVGDKLTLSAPLIAMSVSASASTDIIAFEIANGGPEQITITKIKVDACSNNPVFIGSPYEVQIPPEGASLIYYASSRDCIESGDKFMSELTIYYNQGDSLEYQTIGSIVVTPN